MIVLNFPDMNIPLRLLLLVIVCSFCYSALAQSTSIDVTVCVFDRESSVPLDSAFVEASIEGEPAITGVTVGTGCTGLALPVSVGIEEDGQPGSFFIGNAFPNPVFDKAYIPVRTTYSDRVRLTLYDVLGREVRSESEVTIVPGEQTISLDLDGLPSGMYLYSIQGDRVAYSGTVMKTPQRSAGPASPSASAHQAARQIHRPQAVQFSAEREGYHSTSLIQEVDQGETVNLFLNAQEEAPVNTPPSLTPIADIAVVEGGTLMVPVEAADMDGDAIVLAATVSTDSGEAAPAGLYSFTDNSDGTGEFQFTPQAGDAATYTAAVEATDGQDTARVAFAVTVSAAGGGDVVPINDLGAGTYLGFEGGLYPGGLNTAPPVHHQKGLEVANSIQPLDTAGNPSPDGKIVLMSLGMSNTTQEFCSQNARPPCDAWTFMGQAAADPDVETSSLVIVNGALGGQPATDWDSPDESNYDRVKADRLESIGLSENQVQIVWVKQANPRPQVALPEAEADAYALRNSLADIARALQVRYPNLKQVFFSSRIYAGYAEGVSRLNPEPYAYESGFSVKWVIEAQIDQMDGAGIHPEAGDLSYDTTVPWLAWGPYMWANGMTPRSDGLIWVPEDFADDFTHPGQPGEEKVGAMLLSFFKDSPYAACWFVNGGVCE